MSAAKSAWPAPLYFCAKAGYNLYMAQRAKGFPPIADENSRALILGSMPSVKSLAEGQYYAHPRNRFWPAMFAIFGEPFSCDYDERKALLRRRGVALWDVAEECERTGSGDATIKGVVPNDIAALLARFPAITHIGANGVFAAKTLKKFFPETNFVPLPSTSPANAALPLPRIISAYAAFFAQAGIIERR